MKYIKLVLLVSIVLVLCPAFTYGQDYAFKVLANKGANEVKSGDTWHPIKTGAALKEGDEIKVAANAYLGLVHVNGKPLEVKEAKTYSVAELSNKVKTASTSVVTKYTDFILSSNSAEAKKNRLSATGAVHREVGKPVILLHLPENQHSGMYNSTAVISWEGINLTGPYVLVFQNMFGEEVAKVETADTTYTLDFSSAKFTKEDKILVQVTSKSNPHQASKSHLIKKLSAADQESIKKNLEPILSDVSDATALNKLILAGFYEENKLLIDAITAYEEAIRLAPDVPSYKDAYEEFLIRHNIGQ